MTNPTGSILVRRGPTADRLAFCPLQGEIIYDTTLDRFYIGDGLTFGGVGTTQRDFPNTGVMIKGTTVDSFLVAPGKTAPSDSPVQFLSYNKSANIYEFSTITSSGVAMTSLVVQGVGDIIATRSDVSPIVSNPTFNTTGTLSLSINKATLFASPTFTGTVSGVTKTHVGLDNVDNTSDAAKPVSTATQTALDLKAPLASPTFTGTVTGVTATHVGLGNVTNESKATMFASPTFTGVPVAPTATAGTNDTQVATTQFVRTEVSNLVNGAGPALDTLKELADALGSDANFSTTISTALGLKAPLASPTFTGTVAGVTATMVGLGNVTNESKATMFTNPTFTGTVTGAIPSGGIIMWSGSIVAIPTGWYLCDGSNSTPDLRNQFIVGAGTTYAVGATGGSADAIVVSHGHTATSTVTDPGHNHTYLRPSTTLPQSGSSTNCFVPANITDTTNTKTTGITVATTNSTEGSSGTNANLPPYYALAYIMKS